MTKKLLFIPALIIFTAGLLLPIVRADATNYCGGDYTYRSTVIGTSIHKAKGNAYEVAGQKSNFDANEGIVAMTRIYKITNVDSFQIRHEVFWRNGGLYKELYSPMYWPNGKWWSETYSWNDFGHLPQGNFEMRISININGCGWRQIDTKQINVSGYYRDQSYYNNYNNNYYGYDYGNDRNYYNGRYNVQPCDYSTYRNDSYNYDYSNMKYRYEWTKAGTNVRDNGNGNFSVINDKQDFKKDENVYALSYFTNLNNVGKFRVKQELYLYGNRLYKTNESAEQRPNNSTWNRYYFWTNFGRLASGYHEVRVSISIDGGKYVEVGKLPVTVERYRNDYVSYNYDYTQMDNNVSHVRGYIYEVKNPKTEFTTNERVVVLTKMTDISGVDSFRIKHELWQNGNSWIKSLEGQIQYPHYDNWEYNYSWTDFGTVPAGNHQMRVFISVNGGDYKYLATQHINVKQGTSNNDSYTYGWTKTGTGISTVYQPYSYDPYNSQNYYAYDPYYYNGGY